MTNREVDCLIATLGITKADYLEVKAISQGKTNELLKEAWDEGCRTKAQTLNYLLDGIHPDDQRHPKQLSGEQRT